MFAEFFGLCLPANRRSEKPVVRQDDPQVFVHGFQQRLRKAIDFPQNGNAACGEVRLKRFQKRPDPRPKLGQRDWR